MCALYTSHGIMCSTLYTSPNEPIPTLCQSVKWPSKVNVEEMSCRSSAVGEVYSTWGTGPDYCVARQGKAGSLAVTLFKLRLSF